MGEALRLNTSDMAELAPTLRAGQRVLLSGVCYTSRDAAHKRICQLLDEGKEPPYPLRGRPSTTPGLPRRRRGCLSAPAGPPPAAAWTPTPPGSWTWA